MIREVRGDLLLSKAEAIAHGVAPNDDFGQGLALAIRERWPALYKDFRHYCRQSHPQPGELWVWSGPGARIVNLFTQDSAYGHGGHPGKARVEFVNHCLRALRKTVEQENLKSLALPRLATGVGGLTWQEVRPLVDRHLGELEIPIDVYTVYEAGLAVDQGR